MIAVLRAVVELVRAVCAPPPPRRRIPPRPEQFEYAEFLEPEPAPETLLPSTITIECDDPDPTARVRRPSCTCDSQFWRDMYTRAQDDADRYAAQLAKLGARPAPSPDSFEVAAGV